MKLVSTWISKLNLFIQLFIFFFNFKSEVVAIRAVITEYHDGEGTAGRCQSMALGIPLKEEAEFEPYAARGAAFTQVKIPIGFPGLFCIFFFELLTTDLKYPGSLVHI